jgi:hypothetical protein
MIFETIDELNEYLGNADPNNVTLIGCTVAGELLEAMKKEAEYHRKHGYDRFGVLVEFYMGEGEQIDCDENGVINYEHLYF